MAISQTPRTWRLAGLLGLAGTCLGLILGCGAATNVPQTGAMSASTTSGGSVSPPLRSWKDRVTDVQEGRATEIDAQTLAANAVHWSMLKSGCERLERLQVPELPEDAEDWQTLTALPQLRLLKILGAVRDEDLLKLAQLASLEVLNLPQGKFSDDGLKALTK